MLIQSLPDSRTPSYAHETTHSYVSFPAVPALVVTAQQTRIDNGGCNAAFAKFLVDQQVSGKPFRSETDKRIRILTRSADFLWKPDQPTAREYFAEAFKVASDRFVEKGIEKKSDKGLTTYLPDYRFEVVRAIAKRDAEWAKRLIEQILTEYEKSAADRTDFDKPRDGPGNVHCAGKRDD